MRIQTALHSGSTGRSPLSEGMGGIGDNQDKAANLVQVAIQNLNGLIVRTVTMAKTMAGEGGVAWGVKDNNHSSLPAGIYSFSVNAVRVDVNSGRDAPLIKAVVTAVNKARRK